MVQSVRCVSRNLVSEDEEEEEGEDDLLMRHLECWGASPTLPRSFRRLCLHTFCRTFFFMTSSPSRSDADGLKRCAWAKDDLYIAYHDREWGVPVHDDRLLFEFLILEGAQAGLSWITILKKRDNYRRAFDNFDVRKIARYNARKIQSLLANPGIVRNQLKIKSAVRNAQAFIALQQEFASFDQYIWQFVGGQPIRNHWKSLKEIPARTPESDAMSRDLIKRGFNFVGSTICYAFMQAVGLVNDHTTDCFRYAP
jgi:DNA-3-methyladenine glycosylase I